MNEESINEPMDADDAADLVTGDAQGNAQSGKSEGPNLSPLTPLRVTLIGEDGNAFAIIGRVTGALRRGGYRHLVDQFQAEATAGNYSDLLATCERFVTIE